MSQLGGSLKVPKQEKSNWISHVISVPIPLLTILTAGCSKLVVLTVADTEAEREEQGRRNSRNFFLASPENFS